MLALPPRHDTLIAVYDAPDGLRRAEVIEYDEGMLKDAIRVDVCRNWELNLFGFHMERPVQSFYPNTEDGLAGLSVVWADADTLLIDGRAYDVGKR